jgi:peptide/nickel transport system substrate-binding protein
MQEQFDALIDQAVLETDEAIRADLYAQLQQMTYDDAINIFLVQATGRFYMNKAVNGWFYNPLRSGDWYYPFNKEG